MFAFLLKTIKKISLSYVIPDRNVQNRIYWRVFSALLREEVIYDNQKYQDLAGGVRTGGIYTIPGPVF